MGTEKNKIPVEIKQNLQLFLRKIEMLRQLW